jgi:hypothetical protein
MRSALYVGSVSGAESVGGVFEMKNRKTQDCKGLLLQLQAEQKRSKELADYLNKSIHRALELKQAMEKGVQTQSKEDALKVHLLLDYVDWVSHLRVMN